MACQPRCGQPPYGAGLMLYDVIIIGAGPSGSYTAQRLAALGYKVLVAEQHEKVGQLVCCTGIIGRECFDIFSIDKSVILREAASAKFLSPGGESLRVERETAPAYIVDRPAFDLTLAKRAQEQGAEYLLGARVRSIGVEKDFVQLETSGEDLVGKTAVIASGFGSTLGQKLKLGRVADFVIGAQAEVAAINETNEVEVYLGSKFAPGFFAWLVPTSEGKALAGLLSRHRPGLYLKDFLSHLSKQGKIEASTARISYGGVPLRPLPKTYRERIIVVGDAAGQTKPTTGGGIYYDLLCAQIAADVLHQALSSGNFSPKIFARYEKGWHSKLSTELRIDYWARRSFERLSDGQIEKIFHLICSSGIHDTLLNAKDFSFDWHSRLILNGLRHLIPRGMLQMLRAPFKDR